MATSEAFSRVLIDEALKDSGWNLLDSNQVRFELHTATGRADYVLFGPHGPLCVLEAKREDADPYDAKEQGRGYAENMRAPFVLLSNGREHWFWNYERATERDAYRIERIPSREDLARLRLKNLKPPLPLQKEFAQRAAEIREMESGQAASRQRLGNLFQSMLHRAFAGEM
jgi:type I site-specific restriction endonuclease